MYDCTRKAVDRKLIEFYPKPKVFKYLTKTEGIEWRPEEMKPNLEKWLNQEYGVLIKTNDELIGLTVSKHEEDIHIKFKKDEVKGLEGDLKALTTEYRIKTRVNIAIGVETNSLKDVMDQFSGYSLKDKKVVDEVVDYIKKEYGKGFCISNSPALGTISNISIKIMPAWMMKKIGYKIHKKIFSKI